MPDQKNSVRISRMLRTLELVLAAFWLASGTAAAQVVYDGFGLPTDVGYIRVNPEGEPIFTADTPSPGFLYQADSGPGVDFWVLPSSTFTGLASRSTGWIFEARFRTSGIEEGFNFGSFAEVADEVGGIGLRFRLDRLEVNTAADFSGLGPYTPRFSVAFSPGESHTVRIVVPGGQPLPESSNRADVFVDSVFAGSVTEMVGFNIGANTVAWGDGGSVSGLEVLWDNVRFGDGDWDALGGARLWLGLKNSDDQGTQFDVWAALYMNDVLVGEEQTLCVTGLTRNAAKAKEISALFDPLFNSPPGPGDVISLKVLTRIGTNADGSKCPGHNNATGLRLYHDGQSRPSRFGAQIAPNPFTNYFLHESSGSLYLDTVAPTATQPKQQDSAPVNFAGGNPWVAVGTWSYVVP